MKIRTKRMMCLAVLLFGICCGICAQDTKKIMVVSDPHVMAPGLLVNAGTAWTTYLEGQRKMVDYSVPLFDEMIERIKDAKPDLVLITGDLTKDGEQLSHTYVIGKLNELKALSIPTLVIPGNHDRGTNSNAVEYDGASTSPVSTATNDWFATQYANYGYGASSERESSSLTYACEPIEGLVVIGIDSGTDGVVSSTTLEWVAEKATAARTEGKKVIAMMHHPLIPHVSNAETLVSSYVVEDHDNIRNALIDAGIKVIFTGHFHTSDIAKDYNDDLTKDIYDVNTGSLISYPCDYREVTLSDDMTEMSITTGHITSLSSDPTFSTETAKERLYASTKKIVYDKAIAKAQEQYAGFWAMMSSRLTPQVETLAGKVADAFIIHAEGNEAAHDTEDIISSLSLAFTLMPETESMCKSMLYDKAPYGIEGRENVTNDLTLDIELPVSLIKLAADGYSTYCWENSLDITKTTGLTAFFVSEVTATTVVLKPVSVIPESMGFIAKGTGSVTYDLFKADEVPDDMPENLLEAAPIAIPAPANAYVLSTKGGNTGFFPVKEGVMIPAHKAYLTIESSDARAISFDDVITEIDDVKGWDEVLNGTFYNLAGQRVDNPTYGIYIVNGKKVIIK